MEVAAKIPLLEPVLIVLWSGMRVITWLMGSAALESRRELGQPDLLFIKTMLLPHVFGDISNGNPFHNEETG